MSLKIDFGPPFLPRSNGINEKNYYSGDVTVKRIIDDDVTIKLQDAVSIA